MALVGFRGDMTHNDLLGSVVISLPFAIAFNHEPINRVVASLVNQIN